MRNNYLGLADHPEVIEAGIEGCRTTARAPRRSASFAARSTVIADSKPTIADFVGTESALIYVSCWNANEALFPTLVAPDDVVLSDELNHASIIDGCD